MIYHTRVDSLINRIANLGIEARYKILSRAWYFQRGQVTLFCLGDQVDQREGVRGLLIGGMSYMYIIWLQA